MLSNEPSAIVTAAVADENERMSLFALPANVALAARKEETVEKLNVAMLVFGGVCRYINKKFFWGSILNLN